jgi:predicted nucleic acid-binding protein
MMTTNNDDGQEEERRVSESSSIVLDSSAIASIFFPDKKFGDRAADDIRKYERFSTMDVSYSELGSVAWKSVVIFKQRTEPVYEALKNAEEFISDNCDVFSSKEILRESFELGVKHRIQIYDMLFLVLAKQLKTKVLTTDEKLHDKVQAIKELKGSTILPERA